MTPPLSFSGHARAVLVLGLPLIGSHLAQIAIQVIDTLMLGRYSVEALAAGTIATTLFFVLFILGSGFAWAVMPMVATAAAGDDEVQVRRVARMGMWLSTGYGLATLPLLWFSGPLLLVLGQTPEVSSGAQSYLRILAPGMVPALLVMLLKAYLSALERARPVFVIAVAAAVANGLLNYAFIFGNWGAPELGLVGAALASLTMHLVSLAAMGLYSARALPEHALFARLWRPDWEAMGRVYKLGWPIGLTNLAETGLFAMSAVMIGWIGTRELAAHGIAMQLASLFFMVHIGLSQAATVRAGNAMGRRDAVGLRRGGLAAIAMSVAFSAVTISAFLGIPETLSGFFLGADDPERAAIIAIGVQLLAVAALFQLADGAQVMALGLLRGVQDTRVPFLYAVVAYWGVGVPTSYVFGFWLGLGAVGVWLGLVVGLALAAAALMGRFWRRSIHRALAAA